MVMKVHASAFQISTCEIDSGCLLRVLQLVDGNIPAAVFVNIYWRLSFQTEDLVDYSNMKRLKTNISPSESLSPSSGFTFEG